MGNGVFRWSDGTAWIVFRPAAESSPHGFDTEIVLGNRSQAGADGQLPVQVIRLGSRAVGWVPMALTLALVVSTPISWRRRGWSVAAALVLIHLFVVFTLGAWILHVLSRASELDLVRLGPVSSWVVAALYKTLAVHYGAGLLAPVVIWMMVCVRHSDLRRWLLDGRDCTAAAIRQSAAPGSSAPTRELFQPGNFPATD